MRGRIKNQLLASILVNAISEMRNYPVVLLNTALSPLIVPCIGIFREQRCVLGGGDNRRPYNGSVLERYIAADRSFPPEERLQVAGHGRQLTDQRFVYVIGMASSELIYSSPALVILGILFALYVHVSIIGLLGIIIVLCLIFIMSISLGFVLATISSDIVQSYRILPVDILLFTTLAPVYYPITAIPEPYRYLAYLSPTTYIAQLAQSFAGLIPVTINVVIIDRIVVMVLTSIFLWIGIRRSRWREV